MNILLTTDFSDGSLNACGYALRLFGNEHTTYTLAHSYLDTVPGYATMVDISGVRYATSVEDMAHFTERLQKLNGDAPITLKPQVIHGSLVPVLNALCDEEQVDLIVLGTQGATGNTFFGSSAAAVAKASKVPVLIVPEQARFRKPRRMLLADDHERVEPFALRPLVQLAERYGAHITIAHVLRNAAEVPLARVVADHEEVFAKVDHAFISLEGNDVAMVLSLAADREDMDLVAVLHRHMGFLETLFHGSVAKRLAMHTSIPLLVLQH